MFGAKADINCPATVNAVPQNTTVLQEYLLHSALAIGPAIKKATLASIPDIISNARLIIAYISVTHAINGYILTNTKQGGDLW